jgi:hypothetical protein
MHKAFFAALLEYHAVPGEGAVNKFGICSQCRSELFFDPELFIYLQE